MVKEQIVDRHYISATPASSKGANATRVLWLPRDFKSSALLTEITGASPSSLHSSGHPKVETAAEQETQQSVVPIHTSSMEQLS